MMRVNPVVQALDTDKDGEISSDEIAKAPAALKTLDKNGDGKLSTEELPEPMRGIVARADTDKDGFASRDELTKALAVQSAGRPGGDRGDHDERPPKSDSPQPSPGQ